MKLDSAKKIFGAPYKCFMKGTYRINNYHYVQAHNLPTDSTSGCLCEGLKRFEDCSTFVPFVRKQAMSTNTSTISMTNSNIPITMNAIASGEISMVTPPGCVPISSVEIRVL